MMSMQLLHKITPEVILYIITLLGLCGLGYYIYYLATSNLLTIEAFTKPERLLFIFSPQDLPIFRENPSLFLSILLTVIHFWLLVAGVIVYFTVITQLFNPFPLESGIYILMLDANRLKVLQLKSTTSKFFIYKNKAYFLPKQALRSEGNAMYLIYMSNLSRALGNLTITLNEYQSSLDDTVEYLLGEAKRVNKVSSVMRIYPKDVLKRNYNVYVENDKIIIRHDLGKKQGHFKVTRFVTCNIYVSSSFLEPTKSEEEINDEVKSLQESKIIARLITDNMIEEIPLTNITSSSGQLLNLKGYYKVVQYIESDLQLLNPSLVYDIISYREFIKELPKYFIGFSVGALPLILIIIAVLVLTILLLNVDFSKVIPFGQPQGQP